MACGQPRLPLSATAARPRGSVAAAAPLAVPTPDALAGPERAADAIAELIEKIADVPHPSRLAPYVMVLAEAVRQQGRDADAVWSEFGLPRPD